MPKRRRKKYHRKSHRRRAHNPRYAFQPRYHYRRRSHNPALAVRASELLPLAGWAIVGGVTTRAVPQAILREKNTGWMGYLANAATAIGSSMLLGKFFGKRAAVGVLIGGTVGVASRMITDFFGPKVLDVGLSGDLDFDLGFYLPNSFPLPTTGTGPYLLNPGQTGMPSAAGGVPGAPIAVVAPGAGVAPAAGAPDEPARWGGRWAA